MVALAVDPPDKLLEMRDSAGASFPFVSDADAEVIGRFGLRHDSGPTGIIARSARVLLAPDGTVLWRHVGENYRVRPNPEAVLSAARSALGGT